MRKSLWQETRESFRNSNPLHWNLAVWEYVQGSHYKTYYTRKECLECLCWHNIDKTTHWQLLRYRLRIRDLHRIIGDCLVELDRSHDANEPHYSRHDTWASLKSAKAEISDITEYISNVPIPKVTRVKSQQLSLFDILE